MIDIKKAEEEFKRYTSNYDMNVSHIERKVRHTFRVENICESIAISLGMNEEEINLAKLIGLLHDIARFEQYTRYRTFDDFNSLDHGDFGVEILENNDYIRKFIETDKYDSIIKKAVKNHNKYCISDNASKEEMVFCKIIRDADKLDIMYQATFESWNDRKQYIVKQCISQEVLEQYKLKNIINKKYVKNDIDKFIVMIAFIYDFNFAYSYKFIKESKYIDKIIDRFKFENKETKKEIETIRKIANDYLNNKI